MDSMEIKIEILDNGIVYRDEEAEFAECVQTQGNVNKDASEIREYLGKMLWSDVLDYANATCANKMKLKLTLEAE